MNTVPPTTLSNQFKLRGVIAAAFTPMNADTSVAHDRIEPMVDFVLQQGANGLYVLGSTGEGPLLTMQERMTAAEAFVRATRKRVPVIVQVGHSSNAEAKILAAHAEKCGADAFSATPPTYFKPESLDVLVDCMAEIASAAPKLPFYYYNLPSLTGVRFNMVTFLERAARKIPNLRGIKFSDSHVYEMNACIAFEGGRFDIVFGVDEMMLSGFVAGARGAVGSTYNFAATVFQGVIRAFEAGDLALAAAEQQRATQMIDVILKHGGRGGLKATMSLCGFDCGPNRLPIATATLPQIQAINDGLAELKLLTKPKRKGEVDSSPAVAAPIA